MVSKEKFRDYVRELIKEDKEKADDLKKELVSSGTPLAVVGGFFSVFGFSISFMGNILGVLPLIIGVIFSFFGFKKILKYSITARYYKDKYGVKVINFLLSEYKHEFDAEGTISEDIFVSSQFAGRYDDYHSNDKICINIPDDNNKESEYNLVLCDLDVTKTVKDNDGNKRKVDVYNGVFGYVYFPFCFKCVLCLNSTYSKKGCKLEKVNLEDINFNKTFKVYSNDQIESRYILNPIMMEKLMFITKKFPGFKLSIVDNKMYIGFVGNLFEIKGIKNEDESSMFDQFYDEIEGILNIINEIKNNDKVFKM